ncbi:glycosyltransferase [Candidatus Peregrinibacteria bacterium]|nr:glycosyltransferase [Candidatus Peregrinibacteria bacterium]
MKVAIVAELLVKMGGAERVVKKLAEMYPEAPIYTLLYDEDKCGRDFSPGRVRASFLQKFPGFIRRRYRWLLKLMPYAIESFDLSEYDLVISSSSAFAHGVLTGSQTMHICYCHSPMRYAWDYAHQYTREKWFNPIKRWLAESTMEKIRLWDKVASDRVDYYIANSVHVQKRISKYYRLPSTVIYPPVETSKFISASKDKAKITSDGKEYFWIISTLAHYKKIDLAVSLFNKIGKRLVIIGDGPEKEFLQSIAGANIEFKGRLTDEECQKWFSGCKAFIFPSEEDFGITMVEALACGKLVLAYDMGGATEMVKAGFNGELFAEQTLASMENSLGKLLLHYSKYDAKVIQKDAEKFSAERFEKEFRKAVEDNLNQFKK